MNTLYDLVARVLDSRDGFGDPVNERRALRAAIWGHRQVSAKHRWSDFRTDAVWLLHAPVSVTGSIDATGIVTVTSGTIPTWIDKGSVSVANRHQIVSHKIDDTHFLLADYAGPEVASGTVKIVNDRIVLRDTLVEVYAIRNELTRCDLSFMLASDFRNQQTLDDATTSGPTKVTFMRVPYRGVRRAELRFLPAPASDTTIRVDYFRGQRVATISHDCGTVDIDATAGTVTLSKSLPRSAIGNSAVGELVLLVSSDELIPDADIGYSLVDDNVPESELSVDAVLSPTSLSVTDATEDLTEHGAVLTHLLDLPEGTHEAAAMYAEAKYMQIGEGSVGDYWQMLKMADYDLRVAMERESSLVRGTAHPLFRASTYTAPDTIPLD